MKKILTLLILLLTIGVNSQNISDLYLSDSTYVYANDAILFVNGMVEMKDTTSTIYLRNESQMIQNDDVKNLGTGNMSVYQELTQGIYEYNYFGIPVSLGYNSSNQDGYFKREVINKVVNDTISETYPLIFNSYNATVDALSSYWFWSYQSGDGYGNWIKVFDGLNISGINKIPAVYGFTTKGTPSSNKVIDFRGKPRNGNIIGECIFDGTDDETASGIETTSSTLTGNPYPSALDLKLFLINNPNIHPAAYFWEMKKNNTHYLREYAGGYGTYVPGNVNNLNDNGTYIPAPFLKYNGSGGDINGSQDGQGVDYTPNNSRRFAAIGQGFLVTSKDSFGAPSGGDFVFNNSMRLYLKEDSTNGSIFARDSETNERVITMSHNGLDYDKIINEPLIIPEISLSTIINDEYIRVQKIAFRENTDTTYNIYCDAFPNKVMANDTYLRANDSDINLNLKSLKYDINSKIPFVIKNEGNNTNFKIKVSYLKDVDDGVEIYLHDKHQDTYTDLINNEYSITMNEGFFEDRFEITFNKESVLSDTNFTDVKNSFYFNTLGSLIVSNNDFIKDLKLFDINGRLIKVFKDINVGLNDLGNLNLSKGVYFIKYNNNIGNIIGEKIIKK